MDKVKTAVLIAAVLALYVLCLWELGKPDGALDKTFGVTQERTE